MTNEQKCPACGADVASGAPFCQQCGWEMKTFASTRSDYYTQEQQRLKVAKAFVEKQHTTNTATQKALGEARQKLTATEAQLSDVRRSLDEAKRLLSDKTREADQARKETDAARKEADTARKNAETARSEADDLRRKLQRAQATPPPATGGLTGVVCVKNLSTEALSFMPVLSGRHTYGAAPDAGAHHQIKLRLRGHDLPQQLFAVWTVNDRLAIADLSGGQLRHGGSALPASGLYADANTVITYAGVLEIRIAKV